MIALHSTGGNKEDQLLLNELAAKGFISVAIDERIAVAVPCIGVQTSNSR